MLLVEITINSVLNRISDSQHNLTNPWNKRLFDLDAITLQCSSTHGGYCKLGYGGVILSPELFSGDWPPPLSCPITVKYSETTEEDAETFFEGNAHLASFGKEEVRYELYREADATIIADATDQTTFGTTVDEIFTWACNAARLNLTLDDSLARDPSPAVVYTTSGDGLLLDFLDDLAKCFTHIFYIDSGTLYLIDMEEDNGSRSITRYFKSEYSYETPIALAKTDNFYQTSSYTHGDEVLFTEFHDTQANVEAYLADILTMHHKGRVNLRIPVGTNPPVPGEKISWTDGELVASTDCYINGRNLTYDLINDEIVVSGEGVFT